jgi:predicted DNA-binding protein
MARGEDVTRVTATIDKSTQQKLLYIAEKKGVTMSDILRDAIDLKIRYENEDYYPLAKIEAERINQLYEHIVVLSSNIKNLELVTTNGFASLLDITKGDDYLYEGDVGDEGNE